MERQDFTIPPDLIRHPETGVRSLAGETNWGHARLNVAKLRDLHNGTGIIIGVIDTGCDKNHPDLAPNFLAERDFTGDGNGDVNQHGTHTTGTCASKNPLITVATGAKWVHGKALSNAGSGAGTWIASAMQWCFDQGATVLSMSLGSSGEDPTISAMCRKLADQGAWIVAAGGNSGGNTPNTDWPGRSPYCLSVAALDQNLQRASFSNVGDKIDTSAPGVQIYSCRPGGGYQQMSGTSMATPDAASMLACFRGALLANGIQIPKVEGMRILLSQRSVDIGTPGDDRETGPGYLDPLMLYLAARPDPQ